MLLQIKGKTKFELTKKKITLSNHWELTMKLKKSSQIYGLFFVITFYKLRFTNREKIPFSGWKQALVLLWNVPCVSLEKHICNICKAEAGGRFLERQKIIKTNLKCIQLLIRGR